MSKVESFTVEQHIFLVSIYRGRAYQEAIFVRLLTEHVPTEIAQAVVPPGCEIGKITDVSDRPGAASFRLAYDALADLPPGPTATPSTALHATALTLRAVGSA